MKVAKSLTANALSKERITRMVQSMPVLLGEVEAKIGEKLNSQYSEQHWTDVLEDYYRVMEIAHCIRRGGVKAMIYRVETGRPTFALDDYFDRTHENLAACFGKQEKRVETDQSVLQRLVGISSEEEELVRSFLPEIDELLLSSRRNESALAED